MSYLQRLKTSNFEKTDTQATAKTAQSPECPPLGSFGSTQTRHILENDTDSEPRYWRFQVTDTTGITSISYVVWLTIAEMLELHPDATVVPLAELEPQGMAIVENTGIANAETFDDRRHCHECRNLVNSRCLAATTRYRPVDNVPRRCKDFIAIRANLFQ